MNGKAIIREIAEQHRVTVGDIVGRSESKPIVAARFAAALEIRTRLGYSYERIGRLLGGRHYSTIINAVERSQSQGAFA